MHRLLLSLCLLSGCTAILAEREIQRSHRAITAVEPQLTPYARTLARHTLESAKEEALQANYRAARDLAVQAREHAQKGAVPTP